MGILSVPVVWLANLFSDIDFPRLILDWSHISCESNINESCFTGAFVHPDLGLEVTLLDGLISVWPPRWGHLRPTDYNCRQGGRPLWLSVSLLTQWGSQTRITLKNLGIVFIEITWTFNSEGVIFLSFPFHFPIELVPSVSIWILASCKSGCLLLISFEKETPSLRPFLQLFL